MRPIFCRFPAIQRVKLFGSRAKGTHTERSDVDLAVWGLTPLQAEQLAADLDDLPLPLRFDVVSYPHIRQPELCAHINRVGRTLYEVSGAAEQSSMLGASEFAGIVDGPGHLSVRKGFAES